MIIRCGACGEDMEVQNNLPDGTYVRCPFCNEKTTYKKYSRIELPIKVAPKKEKQKVTINRQAASSASFEDLNAKAIMKRVAETAAKREGETAAVEKARKSNAFLTALISVACVVVVIGLFMYGRHLRNASYDKVSSIGQSQNSIGAEAERKETEGREVGNEQIHKVTEEQSAAWRREREAKKAEMEAERQKKRAAREKEIQAQMERAEAERENRERIAEIERLFKTAPIVFASDFPTDKSPLLRNGCFHAIEVGYVADRRIYEVMVEKGSVVAVRMFSPKESPVDVNVNEFSEGVLKHRFLAKGDDDCVWICGTGKSSWTEKVSLATGDIIPSKIELCELWGILSSWGRLPDQKYRLTLKPVKGDKSISLGIIQYGDSFSPDMIRDALLKPLQKRREKSASIAPPKLKVFKPTVVMYDGNMIRTEMNNITKVPRNGCRDNRWERLKDEAERQERLKDEVARENERLMEEYNKKIRAILGRAISGEEIEMEANKYLLLIERSRSKLISQ